MDEDINRLKKSLEYIVELDDNTLALLSEVMRNPDITQADIARKRGVSRQRINTAMLYAAKKHPELDSIFTLMSNRRTIKNNRYARKKRTNTASSMLPEY